MLTSLIERLKSGEEVSDAAIAKLRLMRSRGEGDGEGEGMVGVSELPGVRGKSTSWKDAVMGQKGGEHEELKQLEDCESTLNSST